MKPPVGGETPSGSRRRIEIARKTKQRGNADFIKLKLVPEKPNRTEEISSYSFAIQKIKNTAKTFVLAGKRNLAERGGFEPQITAFLFRVTDCDSRSQAMTFINVFNGFSYLDGLQTDDGR